MKYSVLVTILLLINLGCAQSKSKPITEYSQNDKQEGILVDVRTPEEYQQGHLENALNINVLSTDFETHFDEMDKSKTVYVYCKKGGRSKKAQEKLISLGFENVVDLEGGYDALNTKKQN